MKTVKKCSKCNVSVKLDSEEEVDYDSGNYFCKEWVYVNNEFLCRKCFYDKFFEALRF